MGGRHRRERKKTHPSSPPPPPCLLLSLPSSPPVLPPEADSSISLMSASERPDVTYSDIGGNDVQKQEMREAVELPLTEGDLYRQVGIDPPRGVLLYGPPGTGKTMLAKAVAHHTTAAFIRVVGSEFVQKYLGEGPRMVRDVFRLARENAPAIVFVDEVDAIATARFDAQTGADREVQRILMELLTQMDGFDQSVNVKVIMATNRADTLDPALLRPGRLDRKIEFPLPDRRQKRLVFAACTAKMNLSDEVDLEDYVSRPDKVRRGRKGGGGVLKRSIFFSGFQRSRRRGTQKKTHKNFFENSKKKKKGFQRRHRGDLPGGRDARRAQESLRDPAQGL